MRSQNSIYVIILIASIIISCSAETTENKTSEDNHVGQVNSDVPEYNEEELIELFRQTEQNGTKLPEDVHSDRNKFQITHGTFDELLIEYASTNVQIDGDSLASFIIRSNSIVAPEKRIVYDFGIKPGNYGNAEVSGASYIRQQLQERWYFEEFGLD